MKPIVLENGHKVCVKIQHNNIDPETKEELKERHTRVVLEWIDSPIYDIEGVAFCHDMDNYNKEYGRKLALQRAFEELDWSPNPQHVLTKEDRRNIWRQVIPRLVRD